ncbi:MAG: cation:proton antiporter [Labilithrix sp.]|nr:cation:proton antiporter [Labilithrix sp.]
MGDAHELADAHDLLKALAVVLGVSAVTSALSRRLRLPVVLGYVVAGLVIGPHVPIPLVARPEIVHTLSELGVTLLMFSLGMEFSFGKLARVGAGVVLTTVVRCCLLAWLGFAVGRVFGWTMLESVFTGAIIAISSTTIVAKAFEEQRVDGKLRDLVVGALIVEDLVAVVLLATLTALATGGAIEPVALAKTAGRLGVFLAVLIVAGMLVVPRALRFVVSLRRADTTIVASIGLCFATALLAREMGYSVALGSFIAGSLVAESGEEKTIAPLVEPVRDVFAAVFFVSVGMMIDPDLIRERWLAVVVLVAVVVVGKIVSVALGTFLTGNGTRTAVQAGMSLAQIGELSFVIAGLGVSLGATGAFLYPVAVAVSAITTLLTPWLIRASDPVASWFTRRLPQPLQTFTTLYGSWLERLRGAKARSDARGRMRRLVRLLVVDAVALVAVVVGSALGAESGHAWLVRRGFAPELASATAATVVAAFGLPLGVGIVRVAGRLAETVAGVVFPAADDGVDLAAAPRRALVVTLQLACVLIVGAPLVAITQPFLAGFQGAQLLFVVVFVLGVVLWRTTTNLHGHVRAGAHVIVELLTSQGRKPARSGEAVAAPVELAAILDGLGEPIAIEIGATSPAVGKTLAELDLRGRSGATVLAITRGESAMVMPSAHDRLDAGDVLAIAGTRADVAAAREILSGVDGPRRASPRSRKR